MSVVNVLRWIMAGLGSLIGVVTVASFVFAIATDGPLWHARRRRWGRWFWSFALFWFNVEVWGRVVITIWRWQN